MKPRIIIAETDIYYVIPLQQKMAEDFLEKIDLEIITDKGYFETTFGAPQKAEILIISEEWYRSELQCHDISHIFVMTEHNDAGQWNGRNVDFVFKYTSIENIVREIKDKSAEVWRFDTLEKQETRVVLFDSASGGTGKTTVAMGVSAALAKQHKRVLYINAAHLQIFPPMFSDTSPISGADTYARLAVAGNNIYSDIRHVIRREQFSYLPPFKASLMSLGMSDAIFEKMIVSAKGSGDYDVIVVDAEVVLDEGKVALLNLADQVFVILNQTTASVCATNILVSNLNGVNAQNYVFICNNYDRQKDNALISPNVDSQFSVSEYIEHFPYYNEMRLVDLSQQHSMQKIAFLVK